ncbi:hypothetical protein BABINDRAFT_180923 [Babjeviella inositovora NRRL Y-12698]|uniref:Translation initiation factor eIF2B subunit alpha n=1 Tax=Babjeviella inositovora NRRL Y-12698 TaxID=984486 RepID=A0A1E3QLY9_9ASCO|nr:uncharacterized protein BABINDRAFT_180923 [Babjeviella inositovora NRRL Y-12698]ODQ78670.1 hypothetical protein BABINDRAFT_180923 [Babjeviella inositovora NRRL Y-12698]
MTDMKIGDFNVTETYLQYLAEDSEITMPIAAIESLVSLIRIKQPSTSAELINLLSANTKTLKESIPNAISLSAGCDLFMRFIHKNLHLYSDWDSCRTHLVENGELFVMRAKESRLKIANYGLPFIKDDDIILVHSYSRVVLHLLNLAAQKFIRFRVIVTEASPTNQGKYMARELRKLGIPVNLIADSAVGYVIDKVDKVFVGAEGVAESGGIINHIGSYQIGVLAKNANKPFYVVAESHKFVRMYPLAPNDLPNNDILLRFSVDESDNAWVEDETKLNSGDNFIDFTPHEYITALITDLGVLTPSAVSEELIKMWYD